ncbi:DUF885 domain-containing protein [Lentzea sp. BCCO 10_0856]|uniref:DUF885 domain-containing protein n=1 Tax=Lentzea miocenica TaxID=3095431 RepID=A0ABU4TGB4_9PSEU|nr:DUF885 domain-containing protein [Lentzea sp. BCCO 10_0856]MDX8037230.1 DUF885 domain-containing protein [Lentzea sp. BCCO 10_0856]
MDANELVRGYLVLGLRLGRLVSGFVDSFTGDPALSRAVDNEPRLDPKALASHARELRKELPGADLTAQRKQFLQAHLAALECTARKLAGERVTFVDEVEQYFQVRIRPGDEDAYAQAHRNLDVLLEGPGSLTDRLNAFRTADEVPARRLQGAVQALSSALRDRVRHKFALPEQEIVEYQVVTNKPWSGFNYYLGGYRSRVAVNADLGHRMSNLPHLVAHESYPGHHTEHCRKEAGLIARRGHAEQSIFLINTPQCLMAEGMAELGLHAAVGPGWGVWTEQIFRDLGLRMDGELSEKVESATSGLLTVRQDAALLLHDRGADQDDVVAHLRRWLLVPDRRARQMVRFLADPLWRAYTTTYVEGVRLVRAWLDVRAPGESLDSRYLRLLDEPLVPKSLESQVRDGLSWLARNTQENSI